jgi:hypothetical protein
MKVRLCAASLSFIGIAIKHSFFTFYLVLLVVVHSKQAGRQTHPEIPAEKK